MFFAVAILLSVAFSIFSFSSTRTFSNCSHFSSRGFHGRVQKNLFDTPRPLFFAFFFFSVARFALFCITNTYIGTGIFSVHSVCVCFFKLSFCGSVLIGFNVCDSPINCLIHGLERFTLSIQIVSTSALKAFAHNSTSN